MEMPFDKAHVIRKMLELGLISQEILDRTFITCKGREIDILKVLANFAGMTKADIRSFAREHFDLPEIDLNDIALNPDVVRLVPYEIAREHRLIPAFKVSNKPHLAVSDPFDFAGIDRVRQYLGDESRIFLASEEQVLRAIRDHE